MYIVQVADLHVGSEVKASRDEKDIIEAGINKIKSIVPPGEEILISVCGDIIDSKGLKKSDCDKIKSRYREAAEYLQKYFDELEKLYSVKMKFCPGNHDITHVKEFVECMGELDSDKDLTKEHMLNGYSYFAEKENTYFLFLNSCYKSQYKMGKIHFTRLEELLRNIPDSANKILVLHHTIMSMDDDDSSSIRNAARLLGIIDNNNISGVLHGHIHGRDILTIGKSECKIIGSGALFSRGNPDVNSQFNIINYQKGIFLNIKSCIFIADSRSLKECWDELDIGDINCKNLFCGHNFELVYRELMNKLEAMAPLHNVVLQINTTYNEFENNLKRFLENDKLKIGKKEYDYFALAEMWEAEDIPEVLYFNHGSFFSVDGRHGIKDIAEQLKNKPTSNRAILTTSDMRMVKKSFEQQKQNMLPSLMSIQFSKDKTGNVLYVHMNLRALEAGRFLKINICESYYLLEKLKHFGIQFENVNLTITAFRVQEREKFNCFMKADIDKMNQSRLTGKVMSGKIGKIEEICGMLEEKRDATETIANSEGIKNLSEAMEVENEEGEHRYSKDIIDSIGKVLKSYEELEKIHEESSILSDGERKCEKEIETELGNLIEKLKELGKEDKQ